MLRNILVVFGIIEILIPRRVIRMCERIGLANPDEAQLRGRALFLARLEGFVFVWLLLRGREETPALGALLSSAGALAVIYPRPLVRVSQSFAYENPGELELRRWVAPAARLLGCLYLLVVFLSGSDADASETGADHSSDAVA